MERLDVGLHESNILNSYNPLYNRLVQQENVCIHDAAGCTTGCIVYTGFYDSGARAGESPQPVSQAGSVAYYQWYKPLSHR